MPGLANALFPWSIGAAPSPTISSTSKSSHAPNPQGPGISLPPGAIGFGSSASPSHNQVLDSAISPHLSSTADSFVYQTSYGVYSFRRSSPYVFSVQTVSGSQLADKSFFFVRTRGVPLTPGSSNATVSTDSQFVTRTGVVAQGIVVGYLRVQVDFYASSRPKFTISFFETPDWTYSDFNIVWATFTSNRFSRPAGHSVTDLSTLPNVRQTVGISRVDIGPSSDPSTWTEWLTTDWSDASGGSLEEGPIILGGFVGRGQSIVFASDQATVDPTQVTTSNVNYATGYSTQRKLVYYAGKYYVFFYSGSNILMKSSVDQVHWSTTFVEGGGTAFGGPIGYNFDIYQLGNILSLVWLYYNSTAGGDGTTALYFKEGEIFSGDIYWFTTVKVASWSQPYSWPPSTTIGSDGTFWVAGIWYDSSMNYNIWIYKSTDGSTFSLSTNYLTSSPGSRDDALQLVPLTVGRIMSLTSHYYDSTIRWTIWNPLAPNGGSWSSIQSLNTNFPANTAKWNLMSTTTTPDGIVHLLFEQYTTTYQVVESYYNSTSSQWTVGPSIYSCTSQCLYPTLSSDSLGNLYAFWMTLSSGVPTYLLYSSKLYGQSWSTTSQPFGSGTNIQNAMYLSSIHSSSREIILAWTLNSTSSPYKIFLGSIPLPSGVASGVPLRPWSSIGLTPYEQYFTQKGEYISSGNGLLTVSQTDISVQGRNGFNLAITRVYTQPFTFLSGVPLNYETSPYANLGNGWQLNLPWIGPQYLHYLNGEIFPLAWTSYNASSATWTLVNHQTEDFILTKTTSSYTLTMRDGTAYSFNTNGLLNRLADRTGQNLITFSYTGSVLSSITDTVGRTASLKYNTNNQLANVTYGGQTVKYGYSSNDITTVTDAVGRIITLKYAGQNSWLLTGIVYVAGGNSTYTYGSTPIGTDALNYYVVLQNVYNPGTVVKTSSFSYNITDGEITNVSVKQSDGFTVQGYTNYLFNAKSSSLTRTVLNGTQVQMMKTQYWFDPITGRSVQQDIYSGTSVNRSFFTSQFFDLWGNIIYTRDNTGHESYQSFANTNSQWMLQSPGSLSTTTNGKIFYDDFNGPSLNATAWANGGSGTNLATTVSYSQLTLQAASSTSGTTQTDWVRSTSTYGYPFYAEVQMENWFGSSGGPTELILSPQLTSSTGNPFQNNDALRLIESAGPTYQVTKNVGGVTTNVWSGGAGGFHSLVWKIVLTDRNTLNVYLQEWNTPNYQLVYSTTSLGLSTSFTPSYAYLVYENPSTTTYYATFDYLGFYGSNTITITNLQAGQKVEANDWNNVLLASGTVASGQTTLAINATQLPFPYGYFKIYELDGRTVQFTSATREIWGGSTYAYTPPFRSGGDQRTSTGFLQSSSKYVDDSLPTGAVTYSDGGDSWVWASGLVVPPLGDESAYSEFLHIGQTVSGTHEHYFNASSSTLSANSGYYLIQYVYIPSASIPSEIMVQFHTQGGNWEHRAYWGSNLITACGTAGSTCGTNGTPSRLSMGRLPSLVNSWVELIVKTDDVAVNGLNIDGWAYTLYNGGTYWDESEIGTSSIGTLTVNSLLAGQKVELYSSSGSLVTSATVASGQTSVNLNVYSAGIHTFPFSGYVKIYNTAGGLQFSSSLMTDIWGGDVYSYNQPVFSNSFNPGSVGSSIHNDRIGSAQYQNATSIPEQDYANYDALGNMLQDSQIHNGSPLTTTFTFDSYGNKALMVNPDNEKIYYTYSATYQYAYLTNKTEVLSPSVNVTTSFTYNFNTGMTLTVKDPMGNQTSYQYDAAGRTMLVKHAPVNGVASNMTFLFQDSQNSFGIQNEKINYTDFMYDGLNRVTQMSSYKGGLNASPIISQQNYTYGWQNQVKTFQDPTGNLTAYSYDYLGRLIKVVNPDGTKRVMSYDDVNFIQSTYDEDGHRKDNVYDSSQRLIGVRDYYSSSSYYSTSYTFDAVGNLARLVDANGQTTTRSYDDLNRLVLTTFPDGFNETRRYDNIGNLIAKTDPNGKTTAYGYDALNRLVNVTYADNTRIAYTYDKADNRLSLSYLGSSATFSYDSRNRETSETWTIAGSQYTLSYAYDQAGNINMISYPDGTKVNFSIDPMNRATSVKTGSTTLATIFYRGDNRIANITYGNNVLTTYRYDNRGRPTEIKVVQGQTSILDLTYGYDGVGNVISIGSESYSYDYLNRLTTTNGPWGTIRYGYDGVGNRLWLYQSPTNTTYSYSTYDRLTAGGATTYTYDNNGNVITSLASGTTTRYNYDFENRVTSASRSSSTLGNYTYSPLGMRIMKVESGVTTIYVDSGINTLYEKVGTTVNDYVLLGNMILAKITGASVFYFHSDLLGSTRVVTTGSTTSFSTNYQPFGAQYAPSGTDPVYKYAGKPLDAGTGLYYFAARYYDLSTGRFLSRDPLSARPGDSQSANPYDYVRDNPETLTDPSGQSVWWGSWNWFARQVWKGVFYSIAATIIYYVWAIFGTGVPGLTAWISMAISILFWGEVSAALDWTMALAAIVAIIETGLHAMGNNCGWWCGWVFFGLENLLNIVAAWTLGSSLIDNARVAAAVGGNAVAVLVLLDVWVFVSVETDLVFDYFSIFCDYGCGSPSPPQSSYCCRSGGGYGGGCVAEDTPILTDHGYVPVQKLKPGDIVIGYDLSSGELVQLHLISNKATLQTSMVDINNGELLLTSTDQPMYVHNSTYTGWERDPQNLKVGDYIFNAIYGQWVPIRSAHAVSDSTVVYDIVDGGVKNFVANGYLLLDK